MTDEESDQPICESCGEPAPSWVTTEDGIYLCDECAEEADQELRAKHEEPDPFIDP